MRAPVDIFFLFRRTISFYCSFYALGGFFFDDDGRLLSLPRLGGLFYC